MEILKKLSWVSLSRFFLAFFLVTFSFQIRALVYTSGTFFMTGNFDFYTSFFLYFGDILLVFSGIFFGLAFFGNFGRKFQGFQGGVTSLFLLWLFVLFLPIFSAQDKILHFFLWSRFVELFLLYFLIRCEILTVREVVKFFLLGMFFQSFVAIFQYIFQGSIGFHFLGEPVATVQTFGVAKIDLAGGKILRAFGTFSHANVLGGAMVLSMLFAFFYRPKERILFYFSFFLFGLALIFSFSRSAFLGLAFGFLIFMLLRKITCTPERRSISPVRLTSKPYAAKVLCISAFFVLLVSIFQVGTVVFHRVFFGDGQSFQERMLYMGISLKMFLTRPFGVGLGGFTLQMQNFTFQKLTPWLFQPVHNIFLLVTNEGGFLSLLVFLSLWGVLFYRLVVGVRSLRGHTKIMEVALFLSLLVGMFTIGLFDHYFITLYAGQIMMVIVWGLADRVLEPVQNLQIR